MTVKWYYVENNDKVGPIENDSFLELIKNGVLGQETYVWRKGLENWVKIKTIEELKSIQNQEPAYVVQEDPINFTEEDSLADDESVNNSMFDSSGEQNVATFMDWSKVSFDERTFFAKQSLEGSIYGPYSINMIRDLCSDNRLEEKSLVFCPMLDNWEFLANLPIANEIFRKDIDHVPVTVPLGRPIVVHGISEKGPKFTGIAEDLTIGGISVYTNFLTGSPGEKVKMSIYAKAKDNYFSVEAIISRVFSASQGAFFCFKEIGTFEKQQINDFLGDLFHH